MAKKLFTLAILFAALSLTANAQQPAHASTTWAVVIGVSKYQKLPGGQQLQFADRDASLFSEAIQKRGVSAQNIKLMTGVEATSAAIKSAIGNWLARSVSESDTVLIFFSGHGMVEREFGESYLLGSDSDPKDPYSTALSVSELAQALARRIRSGRVLVIADAVRRDFFDPEVDANVTKSFEQAFDQLTAARPGLSAIIASGPGEFSREGQRWGGHGVFAKHLADVLLDGASRTGDLAIAADDLFELLKGRVSEDTSGKQNPWRSGRPAAQREMARVNTTKAPATSLTTDPAAKATAPNAASSTNAGDANKRPDTAAKPEQKTGPNPVTVETRTPTLPPKPVENSRKPDEKAVSSAPPPNSTSPKTEPAAVNQRPAPVVAGNKERNEPPPTLARAEKADAGATGSAKRTEVVAPGAIENKTAPPPRASSNTVAPKTAPPANASSPRPATSGEPEAAKTTQPPPRTEAARGELATNAPPPPKPTVHLPNAVAVSPDRMGAQPETLSSSVPASRPEPGPSPLVLQLEAALASGTLIAPRNDNAWDLYQRMLSESSAAADAARLKPVLSAALVAQGRAIVGGDVRSDNVSDRVDDFKRAGQMLARARTLMPDNGDITALEKLSAAAALISLQFYDEAERALAPLQTAKLAAVDNALGLVYQGKLDTWRAERAFKRASEIDPKWAAPHYNLALLYRSQQNQAALAEFEAAASIDQSNVSLLVALGDEYFARQQWKQAGEAFRKAVALKPSDDNLHTKLGHALYSDGLQEEANREYQKAQELRRRRP